MGREFYLGFLLGSGVTVLIILIATIASKLV